jgi:hypothetical protein
MSQRGGSLIDSAKKALKAAQAFAKKERIISKGLRHFGFNNAAKHAELQGYGARRGRRVVRFVRAVRRPRVISV